MNQNNNSAPVLFVLIIAMLGYVIVKKFSDFFGVDALTGFEVIKRAVPIVLILLAMRWYYLIRTATLWYASLTAIPFCSAPIFNYWAVHENVYGVTEIAWYGEWYIVPLATVTFAVICYLFETQLLNKLKYQ